jgi:hypothetical protein
LTQCQSAPSQSGSQCHFASFYYLKNIRECPYKHPQRDLPSLRLHFPCPDHRPYKALPDHQHTGGYHQSHSPIKRTTPAIYTVLDCYLRFLVIPSTLAGQSVSQPTLKASLAPSTQTLHSGLLVVKGRTLRHIRLVSLASTRSARTQIPSYTSCERSLSARAISPSRRVPVGRRYRQGVAAKTLINPLSVKIQRLAGFPSTFHHQTTTLLSVAQPLAASHWIKVLGLTNQPLAEGHLPVPSPAPGFSSGLALVQETALCRISLTFLLSGA